MPQSHRPRVKGSLEDLAHFGGPPLFTSPLHVGRPHVGTHAHFQARMDRAWASRWLTNDGPLVQELESRLAGFLGVPHCVAMCNATAALQLLLRASGVTGEVIVPSFTFVATAHAVAWQGLVPVFADIDPNTHNLDPADVARRITSQTSAIIGVHVWGRPAPVEALGALARTHGLRLFFDAAHAFGCSIGGRRIGGFGDAEVFSFHATKVFNTFEGGAVTTADPHLAATLRSLRNFGFSDFDRTDMLGTNAKMSEASAAMGLTSLESFPAFVAENRRHYDAWARGLAGIPGISLIPFDPAHDNNYHYAVAVLSPEFALHRDTLWNLMLAEGILARRYFWPGCHRMAPYNAAPQTLPHTEQLSARVLCLPSGGDLPDESIDAVCALIAFAQAHAPAIDERLLTLTSASR
ncbi:MAG: DegT/DnrJ/EryC1/StrS family aminotransferase [Vicinamibacterales bacterium]